MNVHSMRKIDRLIGTPICFVLTLAHKFMKLFSKSAPAETPEKVLFIEMSEMGSIILAYPLFLKTKKTFPEASLYFLTFEESRYAVDILDIIPKDNVITIDSRNFLSFTVSVIKALLHLRRLRLDMAFDLESFSRFSAIMSYLSGAKKRVGYYRFNQEGLYRGRFLTHEVPFNPHIHISQNMLNFIHAASSPTPEIPPTKRIPDERDIQIPKFVPSRDVEQKVQENLSREIPFLKEHHKIILINPNASDIVPLRRWPVAHYVQLIHLVLANPQTIVLITGKSSEKKETDRIVKEVNSDRCLNFAGKTSFPELITLYRMADMLITNDSGPVHFSAMTGIRTFVFFGPETPGIFGPLGEKAHVFYKGMACSPCVSVFNQKHSPCKDNKCLKMILPSEVYEKVAPYLNRF